MTSVLRPIAFATVAAAGLAFTLVALAQPPTATPRSYRFDAKDLASPSSSTPNPPNVVPKPEGASLSLPPGFSATIFAQGGFKRPRMTAQAPNGDIFVVDSGAGTLTVLRDANGNHAIEDAERSEFANGLKQPFGIAFHNGALYVANTDALVRFAYTKGQLKAEGVPATVAALPSGPTGHWTRNIAFSPDGRSVYVTVGSSHNIDADPDPLRAAVLKFNVDGSGREVVATGVRNGVGLAFHPQTRELWMTVQERDGLGDGLVPDYVAMVKPGAFYGWPYAYMGAHEDPRHKGERPDLVKTTVVPEVIIESHSSILGLAFPTGRSFPARYRDGAFAALRGSSGSSRRTGYKIIFLPFEKGQPTGAYEDFVTGWMLGEDRPEVWGRPVGLTALQDGSLLVTEDGNGTLWRIAYGK